MAMGWWTTTLMPLPVLRLALPWGELVANILTDIALWGVLPVIWIGFSLAMAFGYINYNRIFKPEDD